MAGLLAGLLAARGWARLLNNAVTPFWTWLDGQRFLIGPWIAWGVTLYEIAGTVLLASGDGRFC